MGADAPRHVWTVAAGDAGRRLDHFLTERKVLGTRSQVRRLIADGRVRIGDRAVKAGTALRAGDEIVAEPPTPPEVRAVAAPIALDVLFEDAFILAINKPPGMVVHPAPGHWQGTLVSALLHRWPEVPAGLDPGRDRVDDVPALRVRDRDPVHHRVDDLLRGVCGRVPIRRTELSDREDRSEPRVRVGVAPAEPGDQEGDYEDHRNDLGRERKRPQVDRGPALVSRQPLSLYLLITSVTVVCGRSAD